MAVYTLFTLVLWIGTPIGTYHILQDKRLSGRTDAAWVMFCVWVFTIGHTCIYCKFVMP